MLGCNKWYGHRFGNWEKMAEETSLVSNIWTDHDHYNHKEFVYLQKRACVNCQYVQIDRQVVYI